MKIAIGSAHAGFQLQGKNQVLLVGTGDIA